MANRATNLTENNLCACMVVNCVVLKYSPKKQLVYSNKVKDNSSEMCPAAEITDLCYPH